jgi:hypothetical protein
MISSTDEEGSQSRLSMGVRLVGAVVLGVIAGVLIPNSLQVGVRFYFAAEPEWSPVLWGEHWVVRPLASVVSALGASLVAGAVARRHGANVATLAVLPAVVLWAFIAGSGWLGRLMFTDGEIYISIGNRLASTATAVVLIPVARAMGREGAAFGSTYGSLFDSRRFSLLGVRWFHFLWLPFLIHLLIAQTAWAGLYGLEWVKLAWRQGAYVTSVLPLAFVMMIWGTFFLVGTGVGTCYKTLSGIDDVPGLRDRFILVMKYGFGFPLLAVALQSGIMALHYGLSRLVG